MKNTPLHTLSRGLAHLACLVILFLAGGWVGSVYAEINWMLITLGSIAILAIATVIWLAGRFSRGLPTDDEEDEEN